jgi:hypothetical protein
MEGKTMANLIELTKKDNPRMFDDVKFCADAIEKKESIPHKKYIKVIGRCMLSTNGQRLHHAKLKTDFIKPGAYEVIKNTKTILHLKEVDDFQFPDVKFLFGLLKTDYDNVWSSFVLSENDDQSSIAFKTARRCVSSNSIFDIEYLKPLSGDHWRVCLNVNENSPLVAKNTTKTAFIMPKRV